MSKIARTALFGMTPLTLVLGRACCLGDRPPVGLYDPDPEKALRGALFLGISSRQDPAQLSSPAAPLEVALIGHPEAVPALDALSHLGESLLAICLFKDPPGPTAARTCHANVQVPAGDLEAGITATIPLIAFKLYGPPRASVDALEYLRSLSPNFHFGF